MARSDDRGRPAQGLAHGGGDRRGRGAAGRAAGTRQCRAGGAAAGMGRGLAGRAWAVEGAGGLVSAGDDAEASCQESISQLGGARVLLEQARGHLLSPSEPAAGLTPSARQPGNGRAPEPGALTSTP
jgi:hypothetical protein